MMRSGVNRLIRVNPPKTAAHNQRLSQIVKKKRKEYNKANYFFLPGLIENSRESIIVLFVRRERAKIRSIDRPDLGATSNGWKERPFLNQRFAAVTRRSSSNLLSTRFRHTKRKQEETIN